MAQQLERATAAADARATGRGICNECFKAVLEADFIAPGEAMKLAGGLPFASSVSLAKLGRPFI